MRGCGIFRVLSSAFLGVLQLVSRVCRVVLNNQRLAKLHSLRYGLYRNNKNILIGILLLYILYQYLIIANSHNHLISRQHERENVRSKIARIAGDLKLAGRLLRLREINSSEEIDINIERVNSQISSSGLELESLTALMGQKFQESKSIGDVCDEIYRGNHFYPYQFDAWQTENCTHGRKIEDLVTVFLESHPKSLEGVVTAIRNKHPKIRIIIAGDSESVANVESVPVNMTMLALAKYVTTKYILLGKDLEYFSDWSNLQRAIRVLSDSSLNVIAVGGAARNTSGHLHIGCYQTQLQYYRLQIVEGYNSEHADCMVCDYLGGSVILRRDKLLASSPDLPRDLALLDLAVKRVGLWLTCPDLLFHTRADIGEIPAFTREQWKQLGTINQFQGVVTKHDMVYDQEFSCQEVGLSCDIRSQAASFLVPWCCVRAFRHIVTVLEKLRVEEGLEYELESGSAMGLIKLNNFIPWDIDMDLAFKTQQFSKFKTGGVGYNTLTQAGIQLYRYSEDMYHVKGAGSFLMDYGGITVEMLGDKKNMSRNYLPRHLQNYPTRIYIGAGIWATTIANPGLYIRGRYGPGYLYHVQSWRYVSSMASSYGSYQPGAWTACTQPGHHACLDHYPIIGNMPVRADRYP